MAEDWHPEVPYLIAQIYLNKSDSRAIKYLSKILQRKNVNDGIKHETLKTLSDCYRLGKCGISINTEESDRLALEANKYVQMTPQQMQDYFISLTHIDFENEPLKAYSSQNRINHNLYLIVEYFLGPKLGQRCMDSRRE